MLGALLESPSRKALRPALWIFRAHGCPCGYYTDPTRECRCTPYQIQRYISKISGPVRSRLGEGGPLLDRIDIHAKTEHIAEAIQYRTLDRDLWA